MTAPGGPPRRGRHSFDEFPGTASSSFRTGAGAAAGGLPPGFGRGTGHADATGPMERDWWSSGATGSADHPLTARRDADDHGYGYGPHPSAPLPPLPTGAWDRMRPRPGLGDDDATVAAPRLGGRPDDEHYDELHDEPRVHETHWDEQTGGLDVIGANVDEDRPRRRGLRRAGRSVPPAAPGDAGAVADEHDDVHAGSDEMLDTGHTDVHEPFSDEEIPVEPYDSRGDRRRRRRPFAVVLALLVLGGLVAGIVIGGQQLLGLFNPASQDYAGAGTGSIDVRVQEGDTLSDIARTLEEADVIASTGPFVSAAKANPDATGIQPGVYTLRSQMSGESALDLLLDPAARQVSRVTVREGLTVQQTLALLAEQTGTPLADLEAAAADPAALGLPPYAGGMLEGFLFPATYEFHPDDTPAEMLTAMVARADQALDALQIPEAERLVTVTKASIVQAEAASAEDMAKVARVLENRLADGMPLQLDTTVNYANGKAGITTTPEDRANPSPYNTYVHAGLPPGAISNPGEQALRSVQNPAEGDWRFFVVVDPDTGETRFARTAEEHAVNVEVFRQWLRAQPDE
ncbi:endolytic transglycosylase MltG [Blastococcus xanthinilyticus]|uniref:Endolytic murein transglycosylase n=1 Tax=Blastococcus xanthinilyticus TaxID=1564164 RepID=A0A5S5CSJ2_9ACTN|nr:endolytic transglycosylase MltG [Blastococcus xanthinilyticus]TYP84977.1 UPF0755 protein [Blastococcus xanthinilyticus]